MQQVRLAQSDPPIKEQWIGRLTRSPCNWEGSGVCQAIAVTDNKGLEGIARIKAVMHQKVGTLLVVPFFYVLERSRAPKLKVLQVMLHGRFRRKIIICEIACLMIACCWVAAVHVLARYSRFIVNISNRNGDRLSCNIRQDVLDRASPACVYNITSQGTGHLKCEIECFILYAEGVSIDIVFPTVRDAGQIGRKQPCFTYRINRSRF